MFCFAKLYQITNFSFRASKIAELRMSENVLSYLNSYFNVVYPFENVNDVELEKAAAKEYKLYVLAASLV